MSVAAGRLTTEARRAQIVEAASRVLAGRDPAGVTFEELAAAAGVSRALVYAHFPDKGSLLAAVYLRSLERLDDVLRAAVDRRLPPRERLRQLVAGSLRFARTDDAAWHLAVGGATLHPAVRHARRRRIDQLAADLGGGPGAATVAAALVAVLETATPGDGDDVVDVLTDLLWGGLSSLERYGVALSDAEPDGVEGADRLLGTGHRDLRR
ncbi:MAG TPA: TetR/AcrR family transcriptional regulator [Acidimicrobiales bacterium]